MLDRLSDYSSHLRREHFDAPDEDTSDPLWPRLDLEGQDQFHFVRWQNVEYAGALFKPGITPGFDHRVRFFRKQALHGKNLF